MSFPATPCWRSSPLSERRRKELARKPDGMILPQRLSDLSFACRYYFAARLGLISDWRQGFELCLGHPIRLQLLFSSWWCIAPELGHFFVFVAQFGCDTSDDFALKFFQEWFFFASRTFAWKERKTMLLRQFDLENACCCRQSFKSETNIKELVRHWGDRLESQESRTKTVNWNS